MASAIGLVKVASPDEVMREAEQSGEEQQTDPLLLMSSLARHVRECFFESWRYKQNDISRFHDAMYARRGEYPAWKLAEIKKQGASEEYARIVANKARILESWLKDIFLTQEERPWTISSTPDPSLGEADQEQVEQEVNRVVARALSSGVDLKPTQAQKLLNDQLDLERQRARDVADRRAERMQSKIADQLEEGGFDTAFAEFLSMLVTFPSAIFKGPIFRIKDNISWLEEEGTFFPDVRSQLVMEFEAPNPLNCYPAPGAVDPQDGYFIEHITLTAKDLYDLIGVEGYDEAAIRTILDKADTHGLRWVDVVIGGEGNDERNSSLVRHSASQTGYIDVLEFHGPVQGGDLMEWGLQADLDAQGYYEATIWLIDDQVIKAVLNEDPMGRRPYYKASYEDIPGQFWGYSLYDVLADVQGVANAAIRSLINNMSIASGPQAVVNVDRMPDGSDITNMFPWKIWQVTDSQFGNKTDPPVDFFQPNSNVNELVEVLNRFYALADDFSMIPRYMSGPEQMSGPGRTASGLSMLLDAANKGLKSIVQGIDQNVMAPLLRQLFDHNMLYGDDDSIKGDSQVMAQGVASLMQLETLRMRRNEFLQITANPIDSQIVGMEGRAAILREIAKTLGMDVNKIIPPNAMSQAAGAPPATGQEQVAQQQGQAGGAPKQSQEQLASGQPTTDVASPSQFSSV